MNPFHRFVGPARPYARRALSRIALALCCVWALQGCAVVAVADAAVTVVATGVKVTAKAVGAVADAVLPGDGSDKKTTPPPKP